MGQLVSLRSGPNLPGAPLANSACRYGPSQLANSPWTTVSGEGFLFRSGDARSTGVCNSRSTFTWRGSLTSARHWQHRPVVANRCPLRSQATLEFSIRESRNKIKYVCAYQWSVERRSVQYCQMESSTYNRNIPFKKNERGHMLWAFIMLA